MQLKFACKYFFNTVALSRGIFIEKPYQLIFILYLKLLIFNGSTDFYIFHKNVPSAAILFFCLIHGCCTVVESFFFNYFFGMLHCNLKFFPWNCFELAVWILISYEEFYSCGSHFVSLFLLSLGTRLFWFDCFWQTIFLFLSFSSFSFAVIVEFLKFRFVLTKASRLFLEPFQRLCNRAFSAACFCFLYLTRLALRLRYQDHTVKEENFEFF
jgi:hypothetical protein